MATFRVRLFEAVPGAPAREMPGFAVDEPNVDAAMARVKQRVRDDWKRVLKSLNCTVDGGLAAVVFPEESPR